MAAANRVSATTFTTPSDREIVMTRVFDAPRAHVAKPMSSTRSSFARRGQRWLD
jgi:hypothetical protein